MPRKTDFKPLSGRKAVFFVCMGGPIRFDFIVKTG
jgi:hypothetical protein